VDEPAVTGSALVDTELDARREKETRSAWRSTAVRSERCDREGALGTNVIEGGGGGECVGLYLEAVAACDVSSLIKDV
jgi:hypothetical protein